jgi:SapC
MVQEERLRELPTAEVERMSKNGMLPLIFAHLFSMQLMREIFAKQLEQGKGPSAAAAAAEPAGNA